MEVRNRVVRVSRFGGPERLEVVNALQKRQHSVLLSKTLIFRPYDIFSIGSFEPAHGEMALCGLLEMLDK